MRLFETENDRQVDGDLEDAPDENESKGVPIKFVVCPGAQKNFASVWVSLIKKPHIWFILAGPFSPRNEVDHCKEKRTRVEVVYASNAQIWHLSNKEIAGAKTDTSHER